MKNEKEILIRCIYLITLMLLRDSEILQQVWFVLGFLLHNDPFLIKHFTNFNMSDDQGAYALTGYLAADIFFHKAHQGYWY